MMFEAPREVEVLDRLLTELKELCNHLEKEAHESIPEEYSSRNLQQKYLGMDNRAAGLMDAAYALREILKKY